MKIKSEIKPKKIRKPGFIDWVIFSPKAFSIVFRMSMITSVVLMLIWLIFSIVNKIWVSVPFAGLFLILSCIGLLKNRAWFKMETESTIGNTIYNLGKKKKTYEEFKKELDMMEEKENVKTN